MEVEAVDKGGNFIGSIFVDGKNLAVLLLDSGLCKVFAPSAERSAHSRVLFEAEEVAKKARKKIWEVCVCVCMRLSIVLCCVCVCVCVRACVGR